MDNWTQFKLLLLIPGLLLVLPTTGQTANELPISGYVEPAYGVRYQDDGPIEDQNIMKEVRFMLENQWYGRSGEMLNLRVLGKQTTGENDDVEVREASIFLPLSTSVELTAGRQVLSWGPAQYEFVNDHFSKDYRSFFLGRDLEFLKAPADAVRLKWFNDIADVDLVLTPEFEPNRTPRGQAIPVYHPGQGELVSAEEAKQLGTTTGLPENSPDKGEAHLRVHRMFGRWETALYGYRGFTGNPRGWNPGDTESFYPELVSYGFSLRGPLYGSVFWLEGSFENIREPRAGEVSTLPPNQYKLLTGFRFRNGPNVSYMAQASWFRQEDAAGLRSLMPDDHPYNDRNRYRLQVSTKREYMADRLTLRGRFFSGLSEDDWWLRLRGDYEWSDSVTLYAGSFFFGAEHPASRFGATEESNHIYTRIRYSF